MDAGSRTGHPKTRWARKRQSAPMPTHDGATRSWARGPRLLRKKLCLRSLAASAAFGPRCRLRRRRLFHSCGTIGRDGDGPGYFPCDAQRRAPAWGRRGGYPLHGAKGARRRFHFQRLRFDVVIAVTVLCWVSDHPAAVREMARVLRPGGVLVIGELGRYRSGSARNGT